MTKTVPKELLPIKNHASIDLVLAELADQNLGQIFCLVNNEKEILVKHLKNSTYGQSIEFLYQTEQLGLAHAVWSCKEQLKNYPYFAVVLPDNLLRPIEQGLIEKIVRQSAANKTSAVVVAKTVDHKRALHYGMVELVDEFDKHGFAEIKNMIEKPKTWAHDPLAVVGRYVFKSQDIFQALDNVDFEKHKDKEVSITSVIQSMAKDHKIWAYRTSSDFYDIGTPEFWLETNIAWPKI